MKEFADNIAEELNAMWRFALRLTANEADAEDLVQRTCVKALESAASYEDRGRLRSWLFRIEHRIWLNVLRSRQIRNKSSFANSRYSSTYDDGVNVTQLTDQRQDSALMGSPESNLNYYQIVSLVESLPEAQRLVVLLVCVEELSYQETADILEIPIGTVMSRLSRGRLTLGKAVRDSEKVTSEKTISDAELDGDLRL